MPRALVVTGMHRSGTSLAASLARRAGVDMGSSLLMAGPGNRRGHFEDTEFLQFHVGLLSRRGAGPLRLPAGWSFHPSAAEEDEARALVERKSALPLWGFKDPRTSLFLDFWDRLLPDPVYLLLYRHPVEVALSLVRRGLEAEILHDPSAAMRSWEEHNVRLLDFRNAHPGRCLLWNASGMARSIGAAFRTLEERLDHRLALEDLGGLFFPAEFHEGLAAPGIDWGEILPDASRIYAALEKAADLGSPPGAASEGETADDSRTLLRAEEHLLAAALRTAREKDRLVRVSGELAASREEAAGLARKVTEHEAAWERLDATKGYRLLRRWWRGVEAMRTAPLRVRRRLSRLRAGRAPRIVAIIATYNEERFIAGCLEHLIGQGVEAYVCDNDSTDGTVAIASRHLGAGVRAIERIPRDGTFRWRRILERKEELAAELDADWFIHLDADEIPLPPPRFATLAEAFAEADAGGFDAVRFDEFTFVPTREAPDHDHPDFRRTMRSYYPFAPSDPHLVRAWRRQRTRVDLAGSGGHLVSFPGRRVFAERFRLCHYLFLSREHALRKYGSRSFDPEEVSRGWHGWRAGLRADALPLPSQSQLRLASSESDLDPSSPRTQHCVLWNED